MSDSRLPVVLVVDCDTGMLRTTKKVLEDLNCRVLTASSPEIGLSALRQGVKPKIILCDWSLNGGKFSGVDFFRAARMHVGDSFNVLLGHKAEIRVAFSALQDGTIDRFVTKPWDVSRLSSSIEKRLDMDRAVT